MANWSYTVTYIGSDTNTTYTSYPYSLDISSHVVAIENFTDVGSGEVNSAKLILNARDGHFITSDSGFTESD